MLRALRAEIMKLKRSSMPLWTVLVVASAPLFSTVIATSDEYGGARVSWAEFVRTGPQLLAGWYGTVLFGLVTAYVFGREHLEGMAGPLMTLPIRRGAVVGAKLVVVALWAAVLAVLCPLAQAGYASALGLDGLSWRVLGTAWAASAKAAVLIFALMPWIALAARVGRGYLAPMVLSSLAAGLGLGLAEAGWTRWVPFSMPLGVTGIAILPSTPPPALQPGSWLLMAALFLAGVAAVLLHTDRADIVP